MLLKTYQNLSLKLQLSLVLVQIRLSAASNSDQRRPSGYGYSGFGAPWRRGCGVPRVKQTLPVYKGISGLGHLAWIKPVTSTGERSRTALGSSPVPSAAAVLCAGHWSQAGVVHPVSWWQLPGASCYQLHRRCSGGPGPILNPLWTVFFRVWFCLLHWIPPIPASDKVPCPVVQWWGHPTLPWMDQGLSVLACAPLLFLTRLSSFGKTILACKAGACFSQTWSLPSTASWTQQRCSSVLQTPHAWQGRTWLRAPGQFLQTQVHCAPQHGDRRPPSRRAWIPRALTSQSSGWAQGKGHK